MDTVFSTLRVNGPYLAANDLFVLVLYIAHGRSKYRSDKVNVFVHCAALLMDLNVHLKWPVNDRLFVRVLSFAPVIHSHEHRWSCYSSFLSDVFDVICEEKQEGVLF